MDDELLELRNYFYLGNFSAATTEGTTIVLDNAGASLERDVILARIEVATGNGDKVIARVNESSPLALQAVRLFAIYAKDPSNRETVLITLKEWLEDPVGSANPSILIFAAIIYGQEKDYENALRYANKGDTLEHAAIKIQVLIDMDRIDVAKKELAVMKRLDEYATLTQLTSAWVSLAAGVENIQEALYTYQELLERHGATEPLLNGIAACHMGMKRYVDAERVIKGALGKNPNFPDSLVNSIVCSCYKKKPEELVNRYLTQLRAVASPDHPWLLVEEEFDSKFDAAVAAVTGA